MPKQIVITPVLEFGGSNSYLRLLIKYFGVENLILVLDGKEQIQYVKGVDPSNTIKVEVYKGLSSYAHYRNGGWTDLRSVAQSMISTLRILMLSIRHGFSNVLISSIEFEKYLYLLWLPFIKVTYVLHSTPGTTNNRITIATCKKRLGRRRRIVTVSEANRKKIIDNWYIPTQKQQFVEVIYNCVAANLSRSKRNTPANSVMVSTMGHVTDYKNPNFWLEVATDVTKRFDHVSFYWLGNGSMFKELKLKSNTLERVHFVGYTREINTYLDNADIYYQPSLAETQGIAVLEAMASGIPCVVSNVGGLPESVTDGESGFVVSPTNKEQNVAAISKLIDDKGLRDRLSENAYVQYQKKFSYHRFKARMDEVLLA